MIIDRAHYRDGRRQHAEAMTVDEASAISARGEGFVWVGMFEPAPDEIAHVQVRFGLHELAATGVVSYWFLRRARWL